VREDRLPRIAFLLAFFRDADTSVSVKKAPAAALPLMG